MSSSFEPKHLSKLIPPGSTSYWRRQRFTPMIDKKILHVEAGEDVVLEILTWRIDAYVYIIDAKPDSDFASNGGSVYVVLLHSGSAVVQDAIAEHELRWVVSCRSAGQLAPAIMQLPASHSGTTNGDVTSYPIAFAQDMQMFRNDGNEVFTFPAQHEDRVDISAGKLSGDIVNSSKVQWGIAYADGKEPEVPTPVPFNALSVFQFDSLGKVEFDIRAEVHGALRRREGDSLSGLETASITVDCQFSA